ncbi:MAG TPA: M14 family zinc carboxypeptidase, partial [Spirochaetia bacterium]|nr:M14 family zinc carboxypeptidase [Spirochaetia bacterium]
NGSPRSLWYYFRLRGGKGERITFEQRELEDVLGVLESRTYALTDPVIKHGDGGEWQRIDTNNVSFDRNPLGYSFSIVPETDTTYIAFSFPYTFSNLESFLRGAGDGSPISLDSIGKTAEGRDFPMMIVGDQAERNQSCCIVTARHHAGEVSGSYVLEGMIDAYLTGREEQGLSRLLLLVFPFVDLDGVESGRYGKDRPPVDFNRDWTAEPEHQEIRLIQRRIKEYAQRHKLLFYADLHAPQPGGTTYIVPARAASSSSDNYRRLWEFANAFEENVSGVSTCRVEDLDPDAINWGGEHYQHNSVQYHAREYGIPALCLETTYHYDSDLKLLNPTVWRQVGRCFGRTVFDGFYLQKEDSKGRSVRVSSRERVWDFWEMVSAPVDAELTERNKSMILESSESGEAFITFRRYMAKEEECRVKVDSRLAEKNFMMRLVTYFYRGRTVFGPLRSVQALVEPGVCELVPGTDIDCLEYTSYRIGVGIKGLKGSLTVTID